MIDELFREEKEFKEKCHFWYKRMWNWIADNIVADDSILDLKHQFCTMFEDAITNDFKKHYNMIKYSNCFCFLYAIERKDSYSEPYEKCKDCLVQFTVQQDFYGDFCIADGSPYSKLYKIGNTLERRELAKQIADLPLLGD